jgi:hypothetical protein
LKSWEADVHLVRDLLEKGIVDRQGREIGRADSVVLALGRGAPRVARIEVGPAVLAERLWPSRRFTFDRILDVGNQIRADVSGALAEGEVRLDLLIGAKFWPATIAGSGASKNFAPRYETAAVS